MGKAKRSRWRTILRWVTGIIGIGFTLLGGIRWLLEILSDIESARTWYERASPMLDDPAIYVPVIVGAALLAAFFFGERIIERFRPPGEMPISEEAPSILSELQKRMIRCVGDVSSARTRYQDVLTELRIDLRNRQAHTARRRLENLGLIVYADGWVELTKNGLQAYESLPEQEDAQPASSARPSGQRPGPAGMVAAHPDWDILRAAEYILAETPYGRGKSLDDIFEMIRDAAVDEGRLRVWARDLGTGTAEIVPPRFFLNNKFRLTGGVPINSSIQITSSGPSSAAKYFAPMVNEHQIRKIWGPR